MYSTGISPRIVERGDGFCFVLKKKRPIIFFCIDCVNLPFCGAYLSKVSEARQSIGCLIDGQLEEKEFEKESITM